MIQVWWYTPSKPVFVRQRQANLWEAKAIQLCTMSFSAAKDT